MLQATCRLLPAKIPAGAGAPLSAITSLSFVGQLNRFCGTLSVRRYARRGRTRPKMRPRESKSAARDSLGSIVQGSLTSLKSIALQVLSLAGLVALLRVDWARISLAEGDARLAALRSVLARG